MDDTTLHVKLAAVIQRDRDAGCCMADESLIEPAIRRWNSYERRHRCSKIESLETRAADLKKGFLLLFPSHNYVEACLEHIADSFAVVLSANTGMGGWHYVTKNGCGTTQFNRES